MNFPKYTTTDLEDWVTNLYYRLNIYYPEQLLPYEIARYFNVFLKKDFLPSRFDVFGKFRAILIDARCSIEEQREQFFHELGHILRHTGHQTMMTDAFRQLQEWDANHFTLYAALPNHMLQEYNFEDPDLITNLSEDFGVTPELCLKRIMKIYRNQYPTKTATDHELQL